MRMSASTAARAFGRRLRHGAGMAPMSWRPVGLRWRRATRPAAPRFVRSSLPTTSNSWFSLFHLHFHVTDNLSDQHRQISSPLHTATTVWRSALERCIPGLTPTQVHHPVARARQRPQHICLVPALRYSVSRQSKTVVAATISKAAPHRVEHAFRRTIHPASQHLVAVASAHRRNAVNAARPVLSPIAAAPLRWFVSGRRVQREPRFEPPDMIPRPVPSRTTASSRTLTDRTTELLWRTTAKINIDAVERIAAADITSSSMTPARPGSARAAAPTIASQAGVIETTRPMTQDPAFVDRLAEDMIRRMARHVRIERERRGF